MIFSKICLPDFFGPAGFILDQLKSNNAGPNVRHSSQSFRNLWAVPNNYSGESHSVGVHDKFADLLEFI